MEKVTKKDLKLALTFNDVLLVPSKSNILPRDVDVSSRLTDNIILQTPILSAAMDTVTENAMAIAMAREGGLGVLHKNMSIERQCIEVERVKRSESGVIIDPVTIAPDKSVRDAVSIMRNRSISGLPVIDDENQLVGILTERDIRFEENLDQPVSAVMTSKKLVTDPKGTTLEDARKILQKKRIEKLLIVEQDGTLCGLGSLWVNDAEKSQKDSPGNMFVPIDLLKPIYDDLVSKGIASGEQRPWLGLYTAEAMNRLFVSGVIPDGPADLSAVEPGDLITGINDQDVPSLPAMYRLLWSLGPAGTDITLNLRRDGEDIDIVITSDSRYSFMDRRKNH